MGLLSGKVALVAGIGPGLGAETAGAFAREGAAVVLMARSDRTSAGVAAAIEAQGGQAAVVTGSVTDASACVEAVAVAETRFGGLDILVNNAFSQGQPGPAMTAMPDGWRQVFDVNLLGPLAMTQAAAPALARRGGGSIIMVSSDQAWRVVPGFAAYSASKAALGSLTRHLATELGPQNIRVNAVHPGMIMGDALRDWFHHMAAEQGVDYAALHDPIAGQAALGRIADAEEMAGALVFFASDLARAVTGQSLCVDAGAHFH